ncbi:MAG TPA: HAD hydrolase-like protein [Dehalococcoidia bacterium]|nr:HAD hydrolase-like protein [Dehalococcoidia bacterium]
MSHAGPTLYLDLDGTILDVSQRYHAVYSRLLEQLGGEPVTKSHYWRLRRLNAPMQDLLAGLDEEGQELFRQGWLDSIETPSYLALDSLLPGVRSALDSLRREYRLVLVTLRRDRKALLAQLNSLALSNLFASVLTPSEQGAPGELKGDLLKRDATSTESGIVVGDSEADVQAARQADLPVVCVTSGIRDRDFLARLAPDAIIDSLVELKSLLDSNAFLNPAGSLTALWKGAK